MSTRTRNRIQFVSPRTDIEIHLPDGRVISGPRGTPVGDLLKPLEFSPEFPAPVVGGIVNYELRELTYPILMDSHVIPVSMADPDGMRIYRRSLVFLLETAFFAAFPDATLTVDHSVASGGYFCQVTGRPALTAFELSQLEQGMRQIVAGNLPFKRREVPLSEAIVYFRQNGKDDKVQLLIHRQKDYLTIYELEGHYDYHHGYMVPSTGYLRWFGLDPVQNGFTLRFPRRHAPTTLLPLPEYPKLLATFRQYGDWLQRLGISNVGALNDAIKAGRVGEVILVSEALHEQQVAEIAAKISACSQQVRIVFIAGPSSSGKTTFSRRLSVQLLARGISPFPLEMDNYFIDRDLTPLDEDGKPDFESIQALDRQKLSADVLAMIRGQETQIPRYDFISGLSAPGEVIKLNRGEVIILEGIHGLNWELVPGIDPSQTFRIYISALTQLNLDRHNRVSTTDTRLIRRIVRDARERGYNATQTISRWESVRRGEKRYIFPFQENADHMFNSALAYELSVLKPLAEPLLRQVSYRKPEYVEAKRLMAFLDWFLPLEPERIPNNSILREFIGGSNLKDFKLWHNHHEPR